MTSELERMQQLAESLEKEDRRALVIQIWDGEIKGASELVVKALRAYEALDKLRDMNAAEYLRVVARETKHQFDKHELPKVAYLIDAALASSPLSSNTRGSADT